MWFKRELRFFYFNDWSLILKAFHGIYYQAKLTKLDSCLPAAALMQVQRCKSSKRNGMLLKNSQQITGTHFFNPRDDRSFPSFFRFLFTSLFFKSSPPPSEAGGTRVRMLFAQRSVWMLLDRSCALGHRLLHAAPCEPHHKSAVRAVSAGAKGEMEDGGKAKGEGAEEGRGGGLEGGDPFSERDRKS